MRIFRWENPKIIESDLFIKLDEQELEKLALIFPDIKDACAENDGYYVFINTVKKTITPLRTLSLVFGGMYNDDVPYGDELDNISIDFNSLTLQECI